MINDKGLPNNTNTIRYDGANPRGPPHVVLAAAQVRTPAQPVHFTCHSCEACVDAHDRPHRLNAALGRPAEQSSTALGSLDGLC